MQLNLIATEQYPSPLIHVMPYQVYHEYIFLECFSYDSLQLKLSAT